MIMSMVFKEFFFFFNFNTSAFVDGVRYREWIESNRVITWKAGRGKTVRK